MADLKLRNEHQRLIRTGGGVLIYYTASDKNDVVASVRPVNATALTLLRQPSFEGELKIVITDGGGAISDGDITVIGRDSVGASATEVVDISGGAGTYHTAAGWTYITSITPSSLVGDDANTRIEVGTAPAAGEDIDSPRLADRLWVGLAPLAVGDNTQWGAAPPLANDWILRGPENQAVIDFEALVAGTASNAPILEESGDGGASVTDTFADSNNADEHIQQVVTLTSPRYRFRFESANEQTGKFDCSVTVRRTP